MLAKSNKERKNENKFAYIKLNLSRAQLYRVPLQRYDIHGKQLLESNDKYYFEDLGIRNKLVRTRQTNDIEKRIENAVYLHLLLTLR